MVVTCFQLTRSVEVHTFQSTIWNLVASGERSCPTYKYAVSSKMWMWGSAIPFPTTIGFFPVAGEAARSSVSIWRQPASGRAPQRSPNRLMDHTPQESCRVDVFASRTGKLPCSTTYFFASAAKGNLSGGERKTQRYLYCFVLPTSTVVFWLFSLPKRIVGQNHSEDRERPK